MDLRATQKNSVSIDLDLLVSSSFSTARAVGGKKRTFDLISRSNTVSKQTHAFDEMSLYSLLQSDNFREGREEFLEDDYSVIRL